MKSWTHFMFVEDQGLWVSVAKPKNVSIPSYNNWIELVNLQRQNKQKSFLAFQNLRENLNNTDVFLIYYTIKCEQPRQNTVSYSV